MKQGALHFTLCTYCKAYMREKSYNGSTLRYIYGTINLSILGIKIENYIDSTIVHNELLKCYAEMSMRIIQKNRISFQA